jgi:hypothetical protein
MSKITINGWDRRAWTLSIIVAAMIAVLLWVIFFYHSRSNEIRIITIQNPQKLNVRNFSKDYEFVNHSDLVTAIIVQGNDMVAIQSMIIPANEIKSDNWKIVIQDKSKLLVNGMLKGMMIEDDHSFQEFFNLPEKDLKHLSSIRLEFDNYRLRSFLSKLSSLNNNLIIEMGEGQLTNLQREIAAKFNPGLFLMNYDPQTLEILSKKENGPEQLWIRFDSVIPATPIPRLRSLKEISLYSFDAPLPSNLLENNYSIKDVLLWTGNDSFELPKSRIRNLSLMDSGTIRLKKYQLRRLDYFNGIMDDKRIVELSKMKRLQWLHANVQNLDQLQFEGMIKAIPNIKVLDLDLSDKYISLNSLKSLDELKALTLTYYDSLDAASISSLKNLRYLSLYVDNKSQNKIYDEIKKALPGTIVVRHDGPCMGSGYLLLIPFICIGLYFFKRIKLYH